MALAEPTISGGAAAAVAAHAAEADPHTGYQQETEKGVAGGYAGLGVDSLVPSTQAPAKAVYSTGGGQALVAGDVGAAVAGAAPTAHAGSHATGQPDVVTPGSIGAAVAGAAPATHAASHATGQPDALTPAAIGASDTGHTHADVISLARGGANLTQAPAAQTLGAAETVDTSTGITRITLTANRTAHSTVPLEAGTFDGQAAQIEVVSPYTLTLTGGAAANFAPRGRGNRTLGRNARMRAYWDSARSLWLPDESGPYTHDAVQADWIPDAAAGGGGIWNYLVDGATSPSGWVYTLVSGVAPAICRINANGSAQVSITAGAASVTQLHKIVPVTAADLAALSEIVLSYTADATGTGLSAAYRNIYVSDDSTLASGNFVNLFCQSSGAVEAAYARVKIDNVERYAGAVAQAVTWIAARTFYARFAADSQHWRMSTSALGRSIGPAATDAAGSTTYSCWIAPLLVAAGQMAVVLRWQSSVGFPAVADTMSALQFQMPR